ncbi:MAG: iron-sulfur cluster repair di-iron protein [Flavobacteriales bacterium]|jgi:regulator of cell morphogenesis and NO signaling|nr:iron-sulfur cluster repair di-iron protein [Flavobacteriales bacterium]
MEITKDTFIGEIVANNYETATVFSKHQIDFCCNGNRTLATACETTAVSVLDLIEELSSVTSHENESQNYHSWDLGFLADYIYNQHHTYIERKVPEIKQYLTKITSVHGEQHPELHQIKSLFFGAADDLIPHLKKEELILFPYFKKLDQALKTKSKVQSPQFGTVMNPINMMHHEHDNEGNRFREIARLSNNYTPPKDACNSYRVTYALLQEFEKDLHKHIHIENNILFKRAIALEKELMN